MLKKISLLALGFLMAVPFAASAVSVPWNRPYAGLIYPIYSNDAVVIGGTSTTTASQLQVFGTTTATNLYSTSDLIFDGEIKPDGATCSNGQILKKTAANDWDCATDTGTITGGDTQILFFDGANNPAGDAGAVYNKTTDTITTDKLNLTANTGHIVFDSDAALGVTTTLQDSAASSAKTITLPNSTTVLSGLATNETHTGNKTFSGNVNVTGANGITINQSPAMIDFNTSGTDFSISNDGVSFSIVNSGVGYTFFSSDSLENVILGEPTLSTSVQISSAGATTIKTGSTALASFYTGESIFNDGGADIDYRFEGDNDANLLFTDAGNDRVGVGTSTPNAKLAIQPATSVTAPTLLFNVASSTGATLFSTNGAGHIRTGGATPTLSSCGTNPSISGNDTSGTVTVGSGVVTACTLTFSVTRSNTPRVVGVVTGGGLNIAGGYSAKSTSAVTFSFATTVGGGTFDYLIIE